MSPTRDSDPSMTFSETVLHWYAENGRDLPWRRTRDPYAVWLSEIILQQTRVAQGRAYWERFLEHFPTVTELAAAPEDEVLRLWQGLGYYSRARNLHAAAKQIVSMGGFPSTIEGIRSLKGVGDYTAAAIGSIACGLPAAVVDGNVYRVLARHFGIATPVGTTEAKKEFTALAQRLLPPDEPAAFNQGMMDFGATCCTPANPSCLTCPLQASCQAFRTGRVDLLPVKKEASKPLERRLTYVYVHVDGHIALHRRGPGDIWQGLWEPWLVTEVTEVPEGAHPVVRGFKHQLTHRTLFTDFFFWEPARRPSLPDGYVWIPEAELDRYAKPRLFELLLEKLYQPSTADREE